MGSGTTVVVAKALDRNNAGRLYNSNILHYWIKYLLFSRHEVTMPKLESKVLSVEKNSR
ncbi:site-specific DNA-methyltransferase [Patescibacteria group bacterium]|nr:site-specific DNA-methyltransferase [Patescibacteria group bacterium]